MRIVLIISFLLLTAGTYNVDYVPDLDEGSTPIVNENFRKISDKIENEVSALNTSISNAVPSGVIVMWSGAIADIPSGWKICDGTNGTPDLRDRFIVGAKQDDGGVAKTNITGSLTQSGGSTTISISQMPSHSHKLYFADNTGPGGVPISTSFLNNTGGSYDSNTQNTEAGSTYSIGNTGSGDPYTQPYYALAFIMKE